VVIGLLALGWWRFSRTAPVLARDLGTPASRLVGHWLLHSPSEVPSAHLFFGPTAPDGDRRGDAVLVDVDGGMTFRGAYRVEHQFPQGLDMTIWQELGPSLTRRASLTLAEDGLHGRYRYQLLDAELNLRLQYLDALTRPPPDFAEKLRAARRPR
jgi:hypothetical protein